MGLPRSDRIRSLVTGFVLCTSVVLLFWLGLVPAQELAPISGNHLNYVPFTTELSGDQPMRLEVIMALNHPDELAQLESDLQDRDSPFYHQWLTPAQFADRFGPAIEQMQAVANWLNSRGLHVTGMDRLARTVQFTGLYSEVKASLQTRILTDGVNYGNVSDPQVPAELAPLIVSIEGLYKGGPARAHGDVIVSTCSSPKDCKTHPHFGPGDLYTFYDETSVLNAGNLGTSGDNHSGDCVAMPETGSINTQALTNFITQFQGLPSPLPSPGVLPPISYTAVNPPVNGATPKATPGLPSDYEPYLDVEWVHAVSPKTAIRVYYEVHGNYLNAIRFAVLENRCGVISSSVEGFCDPVTTIRALDDVEAQAAAQGQTIFKSSGDYGDQWYCGSPIPATLPSGYPDQQPYNQSNCGAPANGYTDANGNIYQPSIDEEAASPNITVVGGSQFRPSYAPTPAANDLSTVDQGLETAWNDNNTPSPGATPTPSAGTQNCPVKDASGGGPSVIFPKPAWQNGTGVPNDQARDIPDVAMGAAGAKPGFFVAGQNSKDAAPAFVAVGGTSIATPMWAGISRLIAQAQGVTRLGNINSRLYELGRLQSSGLHDITSGNNDDNGVVGYEAGLGFDLVTGWGSPDIARLIAAFPGAFATTSPSKGVVTRPVVAAAGSFTVTNTTSGPLLLNLVKINLSSPAIFSTLKLTVQAKDGTQVAAAHPSATAVFTFAHPPRIPSAMSARLVLAGITPFKSGASTQMIPQGGIIVGDGYGGIIEVSGLPGNLGTVTVQH